MEEKSFNSPLEFLSHFNETDLAHLLESLYTFSPTFVLGVHPADYEKIVKYMQAITPELSNKVHLMDPATFQREWQPKLKTPPFSDAIVFNYQTQKVVSGPIHVPPKFGMNLHEAICRVFSPHGQKALMHTWDEKITKWVSEFYTFVQTSLPKKPSKSEILAFLQQHTQHDEYDAPYYILAKRLVHVYGTQFQSFLESV